MDKQYAVLDTHNYKWYKEYDEAETAAKRSVGSFNGRGANIDFVVVKAVAVAKQPVPDVEVNKL